MPRPHRCRRRNRDSEVVKTHKCTLCQKRKSLKCFWFISSRNRYDTRCKTCDYKLKKQKRQEKSRARLQRLATTFETCQNCGRRQPLTMFYGSVSKSVVDTTACKECCDKAERQRQQAYKRKYGISLRTYSDLLEKQGNKCAICKTMEPGGSGRRFAVDHNRKTGVVRGLLCNNCNRGIGHLKENPETLRQAAKYLETNNLST